MHCLRCRILQKESRTRTDSSVVNIKPCVTGSNNSSDDDEPKTKVFDDMNTSIQSSPKHRTLHNLADKADNHMVSVEAPDKLSCDAQLLSDSLSNINKEVTIIRENPSAMNEIERTSVDGSETSSEEYEYLSIDEILASNIEKGQTLADIQSSISASSSETDSNTNTSVITNKTDPKSVNQGKKQKNGVINGENKKEVTTTEEKQKYVSGEVNEYVEIIEADDSYTEINEEDETYATLTENESKRKVSENLYEKLPTDENNETTTSTQSNSTVSNVVTNESKVTTTESNDTKSSIKRNVSVENEKTPTRTMKGRNNEDTKDTNKDKKNTESPAVVQPLQISPEVQELRFV